MRSLTPRARAQAERLFSEDEEAQLQGLFELGEEQLATLLSACSFIFEQAAYATTPPDSLRDELLKAGVQQEQAEAFAATWREEGAAFVQQLKERAALAPQHLHAIDWAVCVGTASSAGRVQQPQACVGVEG